MTRVVSGYGCLVGIGGLRRGCSTSGRPSTACAVRAGARCRAGSAIGSAIARVARSGRGGTCSSAGTAGRTCDPIPDSADSAD